jgi:excisionase family DNA binding protein
MSSNQSITVSQVAIDSPVMTKEMFAQKVGLSTETIRGMIYSNALPTVKRGKHRLINIAALTDQCLQEAEQSISSKK